MTIFNSGIIYTLSKMHMHVFVQFMIMFPGWFWNMGNLVPSHLVLLLVNYSCAVFMLNYCRNSYQIQSLKAKILKISQGAQIVH